MVPSSKMIGNEVIPRSKNDGRKWAIIEMSSTMTVPFDGHVEAWNVYSDKDTTVVMMIWRQDPLNDKKFTLIGQNFISLEAYKPNLVNVPDFNQINVKKGDVIGFWFPPHLDVGVKYDSCSDSKTKIYVLKVDTADQFIIGGTKEMSVTSYYRCRKYAIGALINPGKRNLKEKFKMGYLSLIWKNHVR